MARCEAPSSDQCIHLVEGMCSFVFRESPTPTQTTLEETGNGEAHIMLGPVYVVPSMGDRNLIEDYTNGAQVKCIAAESIPAQTSCSRYDKKGDFQTFEDYQREQEK